MTNEEKIRAEFEAYALTQEMDLTRQDSIRLPYKDRETNNAYRDYSAGYKAASNGIVAGQGTLSHILGNEYVVKMEAKTFKLQAHKGYRLRLQGNIIHHEEDVALSDDANCAGTHNVASSAKLIAELKEVEESSSLPDGDGINTSVALWIKSLIDKYATNDAMATIRKHCAPASSGSEAPKAWQDAREEMLEGWSKSDQQEPLVPMTAEGSVAKLIAEIEALKYNGRDCRDTAYEFHNDAIDKVLEKLRKHCAPASRESEWQGDALPNAELPPKLPVNHAGKLGDYLANKYDIVSDIEISNMIHEFNHNRNDIAALRDSDIVSQRIGVTRKAEGIIRRLKAENDRLRVKV